MKLTYTIRYRILTSFKKLKQLKSKPMFLAFRVIKKLRCHQPELLSPLSWAKLIICSRDPQVFKILTFPQVMSLNLRFSADTMLIIRTPPIISEHWYNTQYKKTARRYQIDYRARKLSNMQPRKTPDNLENPQTTQKLPP